jgi:hypothetical protein
MKEPEHKLMPKSVWDHKRIEEFAKTIHEFNAANAPIPVKWIVELGELLKQYDMKEICL